MLGAAAAVDADASATLAAKANAAIKIVNFFLPDATGTRIVLPDWAWLLNPSVDSAPT